MVLAGSLLGLGFITKMLQALILVPVLALVYLVAGPPRLGRRLVQVVWSGLATVLAGGWWVAAVVLTPAADRPYVGGSTDNNLLNLVFGYNGFGRITGSETGSVGGGGPANVWGPTGWDRLFLSGMGGQISWLIPAALIAAGSGLWLCRRGPARTGCGPRSSCSAAGWCSPARSSASPRASSTPTTRSPSRRRSGRSSAWAGGCSGRAGTSSSPGSRSLRRSSPPRCGRS